MFQPCLAIANRPNSRTWISNGPWWTPEGIGSRLYVNVGKIPLSGHANCHFRMVNKRRGSPFVGTINTGQITCTLFLLLVANFHVCETPKPIWKRIANYTYRRFTEPLTYPTSGFLPETRYLCKHPCTSISPYGIFTADCISSR